MGRPTKGEIYTILISLAIIAIPSFIYMLVRKDYSCDWTGFGVCPTTDNTRPEKTLWDWMDLLLVPLVLAVGGFIYNWAEKRNDRRIADERATNDQRIADERATNDQRIAERHAQDTALQTYFDQMTELLLEYNLRDIKNTTEVRDVARVRTLTALRRLDRDRRNILISFLKDSKLISLNPEESVINLTDIDLANVDLAGINFARINLSRANLSGANLSGANLNGAILEDAILEDAILEGSNLGGTNLERAYLERARLSGASLRGTNLKEANLRGANLRGARLSQTNLIGADLENTNLEGAIRLTQEQLDACISLLNATMPDGTKYQGF